RALEQTPARLGRVARGAEGPAAGDRLEDDAAPPFLVPLREEPEGKLDPLGIVIRGGRQLLQRKRRARDDEQRLDGPRELVERVGGYEAERAFHAGVLSSVAAVSSPILDTRMGANGAAWLIEIWLARRSSSRARNAIACSARDMPSTSESKSKT